MSSDVTTALAALDKANTHMKEMFASLDGSHNGAQAAQTNAAEFVEAIADIQQYLRSFASSPTGTRQQQLEQEVQALEQELNRADQLLAKTDYVVQQWHSRCQKRRSTHEDALTNGMNSQQHIAPASKD